MYYYVCRMAEADPLSSFLMYGRDNDTTITTTYEEISLTAPQRLEMRHTLQGILNSWKVYYELPRKRDMYYEFNIPKASGGLRHITAPKDGPALMFTDIQMKLGRGFMTTTNVTLATDNAYAYIKKRWCRPAVEKHQQNNSEYFGHFDFSDFFTKSSYEFVMRQMALVYPFGPFCEVPEDKSLLRKVMEICFLDDGLPQGTQVSPLLSNIYMIPFDYKLNEYIQMMNQNLEHKFVYTRYADDLFISSSGSFGIKEIENLVKSVLDMIDAPFSLKEDKTSYKRNKGKSNFMLGIQLNQDNNMTIGRKRKKEIRWMLHSYFNHKENWSKNDLMSLAGELNYFKCIEPEVYELTMEYYNRKYDCNVVKHIYQAIGE